VYYDIGNRGIAVDTEKLEEGKQIIDAEIKRNLNIASNQWGCPVFIGAANAPSDTDDTDDGDEGDEDAEGGDEGGEAVNINATQGKYALLAKLKELGYNVPKVTRKNSVSGEYETKQGTSELAIQKMLATNEFGYPSGDPALRAVLQIRALGKLRNNYFNALLLERNGQAFFLSNYNVAGTNTGRRSSRKHSFGYGYNHQNFPSHSKTASLFRRCLIARPGNILLFVDQVQAEDWPVSALACNLQALRELENGEDRHSKLASIIFNRRIPAKTDPDWKYAVHDQDRYIGKKARHASNYGMDASRFSDVLVEERGLSVSIATCRDILEKVNAYDPNVKLVFHEYIRNSLSKTRVLRTPFGRERQFISCRPNDTNSEKFKEAFAFIPQSSVGDNTGFAVLQLETNGSKYIVQEGHDSIVQDIPDTTQRVYDLLCATKRAFNRKMRFYNGIEIMIPIEAQLGYDFDKVVKIEAFTLAGVAEARDKLKSL
jgi:hypothetical protein